jgi:hypothetical protein
MTIIDRKLLETTGVCKPLEIKIDESYIHDENVLPKDILVMLYQVTTNNDEIIVFEPARLFVPSFDKKEEEDNLIFSWSNRDEEHKTDTVIVKGHVIKSNGTIRMMGEGYKEAVVMLWTFPFNKPVEEKANE